MCEEGKPRCQFPVWAQPYLGKWWRPITLSEWHDALVSARIIQGNHSSYEKHLWNVVAVDELEKLYERVNMPPELRR